MASKNVSCDYTYEYYTSDSAYHLNGDQCMFGELTISDNPGLRCARIRFPDGLDIGAGTVTSAVLYFKSYQMLHSLSRTIRFAVSATAAAYTTTIGSGYESEVLNPSSETAFSVDITDLINDLSNFNDEFYAFGIQVSPSATDNDYLIDWHGYGSAYKPYIALTYTVADSQLTLGTVGGNKACDVYIGVGGVAKKVTDIYIGTAGGNKRVEL